MNILNSVSRARLKKFFTGGERFVYGWSAIRPSDGARATFLKNRVFYTFILGEYGVTMYPATKFQRVVQLCAR
jgi:hypothetical protein